MHASAPWHAARRRRTVARGLRIRSGEHERFTAVERAGNAGAPTIAKATGSRRTRRGERALRASIADDLLRFFSVKSRLGVGMSKPSAFTVPPPLHKRSRARSARTKIVEGEGFEPSFPWGFSPALSVSGT